MMNLTVIPTVQSRSMTLIPVIAPKGAGVCGIFPYHWIKLGGTISGRSQQFLLYYKNEEGEEEEEEGKQKEEEEEGK